MQVAGEASLEVELAARNAVTDISVYARTACLLRAWLLETAL